MVTRYVEGINFERDTVFGVYDRRLRLLGVGHLAFAPKESTRISGATIKPVVAEFGVSVTAAARGLGWARACSCAPPCTVAMPMSIRCTCTASRPTR
jgi:hypothetical protein